MCSQLEIKLWFLFHERRANQWQPLHVRTCLVSTGLIAWLVVEECVGCVTNFLRFVVSCCTLMTLRCAVPHYVVLCLLFCCSESKLSGSNGITRTVVKSSSLLFVDSADVNCWGRFVAYLPWSSVVFGCANMLLCRKWKFSTPNFLKLTEWE